MVVDPLQSLSEHMLEGGTVTRTHPGLKDLILLPQPLRAVCAGSAMPCCFFPLFIETM